MNWHTRYSQQANWTRELRTYIFNNVGLKYAQNILEVGCGTGAILSGLPKYLRIHGLDINPAALTECRLHASDAFLLRGNALQLPYLDQSLDIVYSHFLLLWFATPCKRCWK